MFCTHLECGESANRIERARLINGAVPLGDHILQTLPGWAIFSHTLESLRACKGSEHRRLMNAIAA